MKRCTCTDYMCNYCKIIANRQKSVTKCECGSQKHYYVALCLLCEKIQKKLIRKLGKIIV